VSHLDLVSFMQIALLALVLLPVLPDEGFGPYQALNPYRMGLLIVLITGVSFAGYLALRIFGQERGVLLTGFFGGLASSTATTLVFSRNARDHGMPVGMAALAIVVANLALLLRLSMFAALGSLAVLKVLAPALAAGLLAGGAYAALTLRRAKNSKTPSALAAMKNPVELPTALLFTLFFGAVLLTVSWLHDVFGTAGIYAAAGLSGLADLDAISLSSLRMANQSSLTPEAAATAILIAYCANLIFKSALALFVGGRQLLLPVAVGFLASAIGVFGAFFLGLRL
jgi:uncharacterized membrane protein (DUF4010 family)